MKNQKISLEQITQYSKNTYILHTEFIDPYDDCIELTLNLVGNVLYISDDGSFNSFYRLDDSQESRIRYICEERHILYDKNSGCFYKKVMKNQNDLIVSNIALMIQFLIEINIIAISF